MPDSTPRRAAASSPGAYARIAASTAATWGAAKDDPACGAHPRPSKVGSHVGHAVAPTTTSGPVDANEQRVAPSVASTTIATSGAALPGKRTGPPAFPAATTTSTPASRARSTAARVWSTTACGCALVLTTDRFTTAAPSPTHRSTARGTRAPSADPPCSTRTDAIRAHGHVWSTDSATSVPWSSPGSSRPATAVSTSESTSCAPIAGTARTPPSTTQTSGAVPGGAGAALSAPPSGAAGVSAVASAGTAAATATIVAATARRTRARTGGVVRSAGSRTAAAAAPSEWSVVGTRRLLRRIPAIGGAVASPGTGRLDPVATGDPRVDGHHGPRRCGPSRVPP